MENEEKITANVDIEGVKNEGDVLEPNISTEEKTPEESTAENKQTEKPAQEGDNTPEEKLPFHKHPRWIAQRRQNEQLSSEVENLRKKLEEVEPFLKKEESQKVKMPDWWTKTYGDTDESKEAYRIYQENNKQVREEIKKEILAEIEQRGNAESENKQKADEFITTQLSEMKEEGVKFDKNELFKFIDGYVQKYGPSRLLDSNGNYDLRYSLELMNMVAPKTADNSIDTKKKVASETMKTKVNAPNISGIPVIPKGALGPRGSWRDL